MTQELLVFIRLLLEWNFVSSILLEENTKYKTIIICNSNYQYWYFTTSVVVFRISSSAPIRELERCVISNDWTSSWSFISWSSLRSDVSQTLNPAVDLDVNACWILYKWDTARFKRHFFLMAFSVRLVTLPLHIKRKPQRRWQNHIFMFIFSLTFVVFWSTL